MCMCEDVYSHFDKENIKQQLDTPHKKKRGKNVFGYILLKRERNISSLQS